MLSSFLDVRRFVFGQTGSLRLALPCLCTCGTSSHSYKRDNSSVALHGCISEQQQQQQQQRRQLLRWTGHRSTAAHHTSPRHQHHVQGPLRVGPHQPTRCMCLQTLTVPGGACVRVRGVVASTGWKTAMHGGKADLLIGTYAQRRHCKQFVTPSSFPPDAVVDAVLGAGRGPGVRAPRAAWTEAVPTVPPGSHPVFFELNIQVRVPLMHELTWLLLTQQGPWWRCFTTALRRYGRCAESAVMKDPGCCDALHH